MQILVVTAAVIKHNGKILISQRNENTHQALKWEFPGGKLEPGESPEQCLFREIKEELGLSVIVEDIFDVVSHIYDNRQIILLCYLCKVAGGAARALDCRAFRWVEVDELARYDFAAADRVIVRKLQDCRLPS
ncbi:8-oxo-dGTP diphosphatase MutT [Desulfoscipio geothermicus]|uniref:8-oxo-dGTP diphosphatase n=1 Tax=Desulfoscipio geothermicus DSM 3669 TaxID=1121426 RepID=A0A1I6DP31_9FIRM|nr:8-oxo-dGTP diphosphatase MutT [Desulfoscipio geothermicus]SFR07176.1 8-oxo-dGTP diphosphatase [Desulfoscipio geothermicus DSM 3669]